MKTLIFDADVTHRLLEGGKEVVGGESFTVSEKRAAQLLADPSVPVSEPDAAAAKRPAKPKRATAANTSQPEAAIGEGHDTKEA